MRSFSFRHTTIRLKRFLFISITLRRRVVIITLLSLGTTFLAIFKFSFFRRETALFRCRLVRNSWLRRWWRHHLFFLCCFANVFRQRCTVGFGLSDTRRLSQLVFVNETRVFNLFERNEFFKKSFIRTKRTILKVTANSTCGRISCLGKMCLLLLTLRNAANASMCLWWETD